MSCGYVRIGGLFWWFLQTEMRILVEWNGVWSNNMLCFFPSIFFNSFFFNCRRKGPSGIAHTPYFGPLDIFFLAFLNSEILHNPFFSCANFWLHSQSLAHQPQFYFCPALRTASSPGTGWPLDSPFHLCLSELHWGLPALAEGDFLPPFWVHSAHKVQQGGVWGPWGCSELVSEAAGWVTPSKNGTFSDLVTGTWLFNS